MDRRVVGWSAGRHVDHPRHSLLEKSLILVQNSLPPKAILKRSFVISLAATVNSKNVPSNEC